MEFPNYDSLKNDGLSVEADNFLNEFRKASKQEKLNMWTALSKSNSKVLFEVNGFVEEELLSILLGKK
jgi:hypothetical protein